MHGHLLHGNINNDILLLGRVSLVRLFLHAPTDNVRPRHLHGILQAWTGVRSNRYAILDIPPRIVVPHV
jgi:hypothetical protein